MKVFKLSNYDNKSQAETDVPNLGRTQTKILAHLLPATLPYNKSYIYAFYSSFFFSPASCIMNRIAQQVTWINIDKCLVCDVIHAYLPSQHPRASVRQAKVDGIQFPSQKYTKKKRNRKYEEKNIARCSILFNRIEEIKIYDSIAIKYDWKIYPCLFMFIFEFIPLRLWMHAYIRIG